ncbi:hypothetical protein A2291_04320 [candidate division WOR-1 bacterium RIFOXYB2_FULL_42_35]|uniref:DUF177 domain-containing protein n=1 Tax=candidate division WOR-1 bacterium RIFOXYC2_FULL_41_25 TaxID=1802586 RepID=A0A1F4TRR5_UNCSA|nr:MAG: hypothetical protein A2247_07435 [candidate division WOR-1 bacterium RIFOXYA2_FULL_41_14]OGC25790.1 MAG: hypothetical protein A2291_04320 [candidate division WOR-1 bacterium RIFOXYB2_FULL_42_35]OGC35230.1 MAG: hypothetical protein A2462_08310 [candidate division WOR-1 bacterium RIFOXYC2_FULL_41_25]OGC42857.1 MAG: hypothetical protein A2548_05220 [candidate division WOR-1 bacterium RIFOXYD2_FULL_41_8]
MKIDLTKLVQKIGEEADIEETLDQARISSQEDGLQVTAPVKINLHLINTGNSVLVRGTVETELELECSRCLKAYNLPVAVKIDEAYGQAVPEKTGKEVELKEEDFVFPIEKDNRIDLSETIRQNLLLAIPIKTLCQEDCKGIKQKGE